MFTAAVVRLRLLQARSWMTKYLHIAVNLERIAPLSHLDSYLLRCCHTQRFEIASTSIGLLREPRRPLAMPNEIIL